ncbi:MAG TPA: hypothetical protein VJI98_04805 [Candidatus Nanoarchaeia archaeon]|nr:hypothetical protein [Candidatus Nanoarchaeia archaeon]
MVSNYRRLILKGAGLTAGGLALSGSGLGCAAFKTAGTFLERTADQARYHTIARLLPENGYTARVTENGMTFTWREEHNPALYACEAQISLTDRIPGMGLVKKPTNPIPTRATTISPETGETTFDSDGTVMARCREKALEVINGSDAQMGITQYLTSADRLIQAGKVEYGRLNDGSPNNNVAVMTDGRLTYIAIQKDGFFGPKTDHLRVVQDLGLQTELDLIVINGLPAFLEDGMVNLVQKARNKIGSGIQDSVN